MMDSFDGATLNTVVFTLLHTTLHAHDRRVVIAHDFCLCSMHFLQNTFILKQSFILHKIFLIVTKLH